MGTADSDDVIIAIGERLRAKRESLGLSREVAAARAGLSVEHLREVEEGYPPRAKPRRFGPTLYKLERLARIYGLRVALIDE